ncbi:MAG: ABC-2 family transporter protein, partial [Anaerolineales bacterium]|nr:ABC-2 family transporter protein [Anaerolineales bacterium]
TYGGTQAVSYPMTIYPNWLRRFFTYVVPAIFLNYYPALWILDKPDPFSLPAFAHYVAPLVGAGLLGASLLVWRLGLRQYQSSGT